MHVCDRVYRCDRVYNRSYVTPSPPLFLCLSLSLSLFWSARGNFALVNADLIDYMARVVGVRLMPLFEPSLKHLAQQVPSPPLYSTTALHRDVAHLY